MKEVNSGFLLKWQQTYTSLQILEDAIRFEICLASIHVNRQYHRTYLGCIITLTMA